MTHTANYWTILTNPLMKLLLVSKNGLKVELVIFFLIVFFQNGDIFLLARKILKKHFNFRQWVIGIFTPEGPLKVEAPKWWFKVSLERFKVLVLEILDFFKSKWLIQQWPLERFLTGSFWKTINWSSIKII